MKILFNLTCVQAAQATGIERFALRMAQAISDLDPTVMVVASEQIPQLAHATTITALSWSRLLLRQKEYLIRSVWDQTGLRQRIAQQRPDVVFFPIQDGMLFPPAKQIVTVHDLHYRHFARSLQECKDEIGRLRTTLYRLRMPHVLQRSAAIVAVSESTKEDIVAEFNIHPDKIQVIYNGYDDNRFRIVENPQGELDRYGLSAGNYFLVVGSILKHKNLVRIVQAFARLDCKHLLAIAGVCKDAEYLEEIRAVVAETGIPESRVRFLGYVPDNDLPYLYNGAVTYLLPSLHEGFGVPIIEAMACGTPVITSNCSAMPEVAGDAALLVDPCSVESIAAAMGEMLCNPGRAEAMKIAGVARARKFRWSYSAQKLYELCRSVGDS